MKFENARVSVMALNYLAKWNNLAVAINYQGVNDVEFYVPLTSMNHGFVRQFPVTLYAKLIMINNGLQLQKCIIS